MKEEYYKRALHFSSKLIYQNIQLTENETFIDTTLALLDSIMGFKNVMMASLSGTGKKEITPNMVMHNVDYSFLQELLTAYWSDNNIFDISDDFFVLSAENDYKKGKLYKNVLKPAGYSDIIISFIKPEDSDKYLSFIIALADGPHFTQDQISCLESIAPSIAYAHLENIYLWDMRNRVNLLIDSVNRYPLGIMMLSGGNQVVHINDIAKKYLEDLGVTDSRLYSNFFISKIYPYYMHNIRTKRAALPVQIGSYLFNVISVANIEDYACPAHQLFADHMTVPFCADDILKGINQLSTCVYIIKNELQGAVMSTSLLQEFGLTKRELQLAALVAEGKNNTEIAEVMDISANTVKTHLSNIYKKMGINYRTELMNILHKLDR